MPPDAFVDTVALRDGVAAASQSCLVDARAASADLRTLAALGDGYLRFLDLLPLVDLARHPGGTSVGLCLAPRRLALLRFAPPYLASARGGRELRYPIVGGMMVRAPGGHLGLGVAPEAHRARLWVDVVAYTPRLGLGALYLLTQVQLHRVITVAYLHRVACEAGW